VLGPPEAKTDPAVPAFNFPKVLEERAYNISPVVYVPPKPVPPYWTARIPETCEDKLKLLKATQDVPFHFHVLPFCVVVSLVFGPVGKSNNAI
jgi:hypothetical protein